MASDPHKTSVSGVNTIARQVNCVCGRRFHIGHRKSNVQCRGCGRWWSGRELSGLEAAVTVLCGGEIAGTRKKKGKRTNSSRSHKGRQTNRRRPAASPLGSVLRYFLS